MRIFISAGEPSGDLHGANLIAAVPRAAARGRVCRLRRTQDDRGRGEAALSAGQPGGHVVSQRVS